MTDYNAAFWDDRFADSEFVYGREPNDFLREQADRLTFGPVLSLGEGEGRNGVYLARLGHCVRAIDQSAVGLQKARHLAAEHQVDIQTQCADVNTFNFEPEAWAGVLAFFMHLAPDLRAQLHHNIRRSLKPGGWFILEAYTPAQMALDTGGPKAPELLMTAEELRRDFDGFTFDVLREVRRNMSEGPVHQGPSETVQMLARKPV